MGETRPGREADVSGTHHAESNHGLLRHLVDSTRGLREDDRTETVVGRLRELPCADDVRPRVDLPSDDGVPAQVDPEVIEACGEDPAWVCEWVYDQTGNDTLAKLSDWLVGTPLTVLCIVVGAWILAHLARRYLGRAVRGVMMRQNSLPVKQLTRVGNGDVDEADPRLEARASSISGVVGGMAGVIIWVIALITVLGELGIELGPLIAGAGIAGVALGFGAQSIVKDFLAGLFVLIEDQYGIGDTVDLGEAVGTVQQITLRKTVLRAQDGTVWHVPNGEVQRVGNKSQIYSVAIVDVTVAYSSDIDRGEGGDPAHRDGRLCVRRVARRRARTAGSARCRGLCEHRSHRAHLGQDHARQAMGAPAGLARVDQGRPRRRRDRNPRTAPVVAPPDR